jgi:hypothetical protein
VKPKKVKKRSVELALKAAEEWIKGECEHFKFLLGDNPQCDRPLLYALQILTFNHLIRNPDRRQCKCNRQEIAQHDRWWYLHHHHRQINRMFWEAIPKHRFSQLRRVLKREIAFKGGDYDFKAYLGPVSFTLFHIPPRGRLLFHADCQNLLEHFMFANEKKADWI